MNKSTILFIRACKSCNPERRLKSVYERVYWNDFNYEDGSAILVQIVEEHFKTNMLKFLDDIQNRMYWQKDSYWKAVFHTAKSVIRLTKAVDLPEGYIKPLKWRLGEDPEVIAELP